MVIWIDDAMVTHDVAESQNASRHSLNICTKERLSAEIYFNLGGCVRVNGL